MKNVLFICLAFWLTCNVSFAQEDNVKIPYRLLWHAYQFGLCSDDSTYYLHLTSKADVSPAKFRYTPLTANGYQVCKTYANGICKVYWNPEFYEKNQLIEINQPKGTVDMTVAAIRETLYEWDYPFAYNVVKYGEIWARMAYHAHALSIETSKMN